METFRYVPKDPVPKAQEKKTESDMKIFKKKKKYVYRSAKDGSYVSRAYALLHPFTTVREEVK